MSRVINIIFGITNYGQYGECYWCEFSHLKLCLADAIHNFKWVKIIKIYKIEVNCFQILLIDVTFYL